MALGQRRTCFFVVHMLIKHDVSTATCYLGISFKALDFDLKCICKHNKKTKLQSNWLRKIVVQIFLTAKNTSVIPLKENIARIANAVQVAI